jgi:hypothetical protein
MPSTAIDTDYQLINTESFKPNYKIDIDYSKIDDLLERRPHLYSRTTNDPLPSKLPNRNTFPTLPLRDLNHKWNSRRIIYNRIGSSPFVAAFDKYLRNPVRQKIALKQTHADLEEEIADQVFQLSIDYVIPFVTRRLESNAAAKFMSEIESFNIDANTYIDDIHKLYLEYLSPL